MERYLVRKTEGGMTAWLVVNDTDSAQEVTWSNKREEGTPLVRFTAELWIWDLGGELDPID